MPRWPGPLLAGGGAVLVVGALVAAALAAEGQLAVDDTRPLGWLTLLGLGLFAIGLVYVAVRQITVRRHLPPERYRGPSVLLLLALVFVVASVLSAPFGAEAAALVLGEGRVTLLGAAAVLMSTAIGLLLVSWLFVLRPRALEGLPRFIGDDPIGAVRAGLGWGLLAWAAASVLAAAMEGLLMALGMEPEAPIAEQAIALFDPVLIVIAVVIAAPVAEELFFRGVVFNAWLRERGTRWAFIGSAALFAVIHASLVSLLPIFGLGLALAWVYRRTRSLLAPMAMHATVNGISVAVALLVRFDVISLPV